MVYLIEVNILQKTICAFQFKYQAAYYHNLKVYIEIYPIHMGIHVLFQSSYCSISIAFAVIWI